MASIHVPPFSSSSFVLKLLLALSKRRTLRDIKSLLALALPAPISKRDDVEVESTPKYFLSCDVLRRLSHFSNNFSNSLSHFALNLRKLF